MKKFLLLTAFTGISFGMLTAQLKQVSFDQAFNMKPTNISKQLPQINKWIDDDH